MKEDLKNHRLFNEYLKKNLLRNIAFLKRFKKIFKEIFNKKMTFMDHNYRYLKEQLYEGHSDKSRGFL